MLSVWSTRASLRSATQPDAWPTSDTSTQLMRSRTQTSFFGFFEVRELPPQSSLSQSRAWHTGSTGSALTNVISGNILRPPEPLAWPLLVWEQHQIQSSETTRTPALPQVSPGSSVPVSFSYQCFHNKLLFVWFNIYYGCICPARATTNAVNNTWRGGLVLSGFRKHPCLFD